MGSETVEDMKYKFKVGVVPVGKRDKISWLKLDYIVNDNDNEFEFYAQKGDIIVVDTIMKSGKIKRDTWDIQKEWPEEAIGGTSIDVPWNFSQ